VLPAVKLIRAGGRLAGDTVPHWAGTADGAGALLTGDVVQVTPGARRVSFMWSYPNMMPPPATEVRRVTERLAPLSCDRIYGAFAGREVARDGPAIVTRSAARYAEILEGQWQEGIDRVAQP
jgi:hypothetical protein